MDKKTKEAAEALKEVFKFDEKFPDEAVKSKAVVDVVKTAKAGWWRRWKLRKERKRVREILSPRIKFNGEVHHYDKDGKLKEQTLDKAIERLEEAATPFDEIEKPINVEPIEVLKRRGVKTHAACKKWNGKNFEDHLHIKFSNGQELTIRPTLDDSKGVIYLGLSYAYGPMPDSDYAKTIIKRNWTWAGLDKGKD